MDLKIKASNIKNNTASYEPMMQLIKETYLLLRNPAMTNNGSPVEDKLWSHLWDAHPYRKVLAWNQPPKLQLLN